MSGSGGEIINKTLYKCRVCKILFWKSDEAVAHELTCNEKPWINCTICSVLRFKTDNERLTHEKTCKGPAPLKIADLPLVERVMAERTIKIEMGGGGSSSDSLTVPSQPNAKASSSTFSAANEGKGRGDVVDLTSSVDDDSNDDDDDVKNNEIKESPQHAVLEQTQHVTQASRGSGSDLSETRKNNTLVGIEGMDKILMEQQHPSASPPCRPPPAERGFIPINQQESGEPSIAVQVDVAVPAPPTTQRRTGEYTTVWTCDLCHEAQFDTFEDACEHEKVCTGLPPPSSPPPPPQDPVPSSKITLFSPLIENGMNCINWYKISNYHQRILKSMKLMYCPTTGVVAFQCQYCSADLSPTPPQLWTTDMIVDLLPNLVQSHVHHTCKGVSKLEKERLPLADTTVGKISFGKFLKPFFAENGIVDKPIGPTGQTATAIIPEEKFVNMVGVQTSNRFVECRNKKSKETKKQKTTSENVNINHRLLMPHRSDHVDVYYGDMGCKMHNEFGELFTVGPLDGLPFLCTFTKDASKHLHPAARLMLQQIELFTISPELMKSAKLSGPSGSVGVRCRNTITDRNGCCFVKLNTVDDLFSDIHRIVVSHLIGCRSMPTKDAKTIRKWIEFGEEIFDPLTKFFSIITKLYSMQDSTSGGVSGVVWGDSPTVPEGSYSTPADIDVSWLIEP